jgi:hypothetical protein
VSKLLIVPTIVTTELSSAVQDHSADVNNLMVLSSGVSIKIKREVPYWVSMDVATEMVPEMVTLSPT